MSARTGTATPVGRASLDRARMTTLWYDPDAAGFSDWPVIDANRAGREPSWLPTPTPGPTPTPAAEPPSSPARDAGTLGPWATALIPVDELAREAMTDPLTGLGNRAALLAALSRRFGRSVAGRPLVVLTVGIDGLREANRRRGRPAGDELLRRYAARLAATVRVGDVVARTGGDEFAIVCEGPVEAGRAIAARLAGCALERRAGPSSPPSLVASVGLATRRSRERASTLLRRAEAAALTARAAGRHRVVEAA